MTSRLIILINDEINEANCMISNSAKLDSRTKQHTQSGVSTSDGSRDMARTKSWRKKKKKKKEKNERRLNHIMSPMGIANNNRPSMGIWVHMKPSTGRWARPFIRPSHSLTGLKGESAWGPQDNSLKSLMVATAFMDYISSRCMF